jgi:predicted lysophospholipase L1 biosynthesis ABC-type transport system permease subunit
LLVACVDVDLLDDDVPCPERGAVAVIPAATLRFEATSRTAAEISEMPVVLIVAATDGRPATTDRVRTALSRSLPGTTTTLGAEVDARRNSRLTQLDRLADVALIASLLVAGCSLAVAVAGGIVERKRPFALLRLSGMPLRELQRVALIEATAPLLLIALASAVLGLAVSAIIVPLAADAPWALPTMRYWASLASGLGVAVGVAAAALPLLGPTTAPSAVRFE